MVLSAPLAKDHAAGHGDGAHERDPQRAADEGARDRRRRSPTRGRSSPPRRRPSCKALLADAKAKADASDTAGAIAALQQFETAAAADAGASSAPATALIDQLNGTPVDTTGTGVTVGPAEPGDQAIRQYYNPIVARRAFPARRTRCSSAAAPAASGTSRSSTSSG